MSQTLTTNPVSSPYAMYEKENKVTLLPYEILIVASQFIYKNDDKQLLQGIHLKVDKNQILIGSTDGHRMFYFQFPINVLGFELKNSVLDFHTNIYEGIEDSDDERVMDGWDYTLASQIPYVHWSKVFINHYEWDGILRDDIKGTKLGSEMTLTPNVNFEVAYDDKDRNGLKDEWYAKLQFVHPPRDSGPTALDGISNTAWKDNKDMSGELLTKVKRNNKIMIEFKGNSTITRTD